MSEAELKYYRHEQEIPEVGKAISIYECEVSDSALLVQRFVTHVPESGDYDRMTVDWAMELVRDDVVEVSAEEFEQLWELDGE